MNTEHKPTHPYRKWIITAIATLAIVAVGTYGQWGYARQLAVDVHPVVDAVIQPDHAYAIEYRKRIDWLPGPDLISTAVDRETVAALRGEAVAAFDIDTAKYHGSSYVFVSDYEPDLDWTLRDTTSTNMPSVD